MRKRVRARGFEGFIFALLAGAMVSASNKLKPNRLVFAIN
jgi:hypothetical protein